MNYISKGLELVTYLGGEIGEKIESNEIDIDPWNGRLEIKDLDKFHRIYQKLKPHEITISKGFVDYVGYVIRTVANVIEVYQFRYQSKRA